MSGQTANKTREVHPDILAGQRVIETEIAGLRDLASSLGEDFVRAVDLLVGVGDRVVVTGMGKSGHIGRKIAATFASVGTPSFFVHPAEASHGDLGMLTPRDAVLALSNSGETSELADLVAYTRRFDIPLVALTSNPASSLAGAADVMLALPPSPEACPMGLAPTTSTTAALALGDALAVALLERKGFTSNDFQRLHPGGSLGRKLLRVRDIMYTGDDLPLVAEGTAMKDALVTMAGKPRGCIGVVDAGGDLVGIITDGDLRRHMGDGLLAQRVEEIMTRNPLTIEGEALAAEAVRLMNERRITSMFILDGRKPAGVIHVHDIFRAGVV